MPEFGLLRLASKDGHEGVAWKWLLANGHRPTCSSVRFYRVVEYSEKVQQEKIRSARKIDPPLKVKLRVNNLAGITTNTASDALLPGSHKLSNSEGDG
jgi:hypothetical protein